MSDEKGSDEKVLCVPASDPRWDHVTDIGDLPDFELREIAHFFDIYKDLEPGKLTESGGWSGREHAEAVVERARERFAANKG
jgi:inorganic pyrophosphatase